MQLWGKVNSQQLINMHTGGILGTCLVNTAADMLSLLVNDCLRVGRLVGSLRVKLQLSVVISLILSGFIDKVLNSSSLCVLYVGELSLWHHFLPPRCAVVCGSVTALVCGWWVEQAPGSVCLHCEERFESNVCPLGKSAQSWCWKFHSGVGTVK